MAKTHLIKARQYPESLSALAYDPTFSVRGVAYDTKRGYLLKLDFLHQIWDGFFGRRRLSDTELVSAYGSRVVSGAELAAFRPMVDLFCLPETALISDVIQHFTDKTMPFHPAYVYSDVKAAISHLHESGVLHCAIGKDPGKYIEDSPDIVRLMRALRSAGRKTFMLTNSGYKFIALGMDHLTRHTMVPGEWRSLFDLVCVGADKPNWYNDDRPFRSLNDYSGKIRWVPITELLPGHVYHGGSFTELNRLTSGAFQGQTVLYLGDSVFSDLSKPSRIGWRTGAIIQELEEEIIIQSTTQYRSLLKRLLECERLLRRVWPTASTSATFSQSELELARLRALREELRLDLKVMVRVPLEAQCNQPLHLTDLTFFTQFNPNFGSVFRTHSGATLFTHSVLRYSDIYTSHATNLLSLSPHHLLFPFRRTLPHEMSSVHDSF